MKLYLVRHGESALNARGIMLGGDADPPLSEKGKEQARDVRVDDDFDLIISSPAARAHETAGIINETLHKKIVLEPKINERLKGALGDKTWKEVEEMTHGVWTEEKSYRHLEFDFSPYRGESIEDTRSRLRE